MKTYENPKNIQQTDACSRIVSIHNGGPFMVRVHESREITVLGTPHRYFLSVDHKLRPIDALRDFGWLGCTKAEATRSATKLSETLSIQTRLLASSKTAMGMMGQQILIQRRESDLAKTLSRYSAEVI